MEYYRVPVHFKMYGEVLIYARSKKEAQKKAKLRALTGRFTLSEIVAVQRTADRMTVLENRPVKGASE